MGVAQLVPSDSPKVAFGKIGKVLKQLLCILKEKPLSHVIRRVEMKPKNWSKYSIHTVSSCANPKKDSSHTESGK